MNDDVCLSCGKVQCSAECRWKWDYRGQWVRQGDHIICLVNDAPLRCVSCGGVLDFTITRPHLCMHKCPPMHGRTREGQDRRGDEPVLRRPGFVERLADGFKMLQQAGDGW